jgi:hypothetical protein
MDKYAVAPDMTGRKFHVTIASSSGARQTILGFASEAEANSWIIQDTLLINTVAPWMSKGPAEISH